jgi:hypothetical protein
MALRKSDLQRIQEIAGAILFQLSAMTAHFPEGQVMTPELVVGPYMTGRYLAEHYEEVSSAIHFTVTKREWKIRFLQDCR